MSEFRASSLIDEALSGFGQTQQAEEARNALLDPNFLTRTAISREQGNNLTEKDGLARDLGENSYNELVVKYGEEVAQNAIRMYQADADLANFREQSRSISQFVGDGALDAGSAFVGIAGNTVGALAARPLAWAFDVDGDTAAAINADLTSFVQEQIQSSSSDHSQRNSRLMGIQQELDMEDNRTQAIKEIAEGTNPLLALTRKAGRDFLDAGKNIADDPGATQELIFGAIGSLGPSAALTRGAMYATTKGVGMLTASTRAAALTSLGTSVAAIGAIEASGTYAETMNNIMNMEEDEISQSSIYAALITEGYTKKEARIALANMTAETAFITNLPQAMALGFLTHKFEAAPIGVFKGSNMIDGMRTIATQGLEEAGQGASSALSQNFAMDQTAQIETDMTENLGQSAAEGLVGGLGQGIITATPATIAGVPQAARSVKDSVFEQKEYITLEAKLEADLANERSEKAYNQTVKDYAKDRLTELNNAANGRNAIMDDKGEVIAPAIQKRLLTNEEKIEHQFLQKGTQDVEEIGDFYGIEQDAPVTPEVSLRDSRAQTASKAAQSLLNDTLENPTLNKVTKVVATKTSSVLAYAVDSTTRRSKRKEYRKLVQDALNLNETVLEQEDLNQESVSVQEQQHVSEAMKGLQGNNVFEAIAGVTAKLSELGFRPKESDTAYAAATFQQLELVVDQLSTRAKRQAGKILSSPVVEKILADAKALDLNKTKVSTGVVTDEEVSTVVNVAKTNPANVNPDRTDKILEESGENISDQDLKITRVASKIARMINDSVATRIGIERGEGVTLSLSQDDDKPGKAKSVQDASRSILAKGYQRGKKSLRSVNEFAADIIKGIQSPTGVAVNYEGRPIPVKQVAKELVNFVTHMNNRVEALNKSYDSNRINQKTGKLTGPSMKFRGLVDSDIWVEAENWTGSPLSYHRGNPNSVAFAKQVENDTNVGHATLQALVKEFPEIFDGLDIPVPVVLKKEGDPAAIEEDSSADGSDEQNQTTEQTNETNETNETSETIDEVSAETEEQILQAELDLYENKHDVPLAMAITNLLIAVPDASNALIKQQVQNARDSLIETIRAAQAIKRKRAGLDTPSTTIEEVSTETDEKNQTQITPEQRVQENPFENSVLQKSVYHASDKADLKVSDIKTVRPNGENGSLWLKGNFGEANDEKIGFYVTRDRIYGAAMAGAEIPLEVTDLSHPDINMNGVTVYDLYVNITNPYVPYEGDPITPTSISLKQMKELEAQGYDGLIDGTDLNNVQDIIVFHPKQIKFIEIKQPMNEEVNSDEQDVFNDDDLTENNFLRKIRSLLVKENLNARRKNTHAVLTELMGSDAKAVRDVQVYKKDGTKGRGYVWYDANRVIYLREDMFDENHKLTNKGRAVAVHEAGHLVDFLGDPDVGVWYSKGNTFYEGGSIYAEMAALKAHRNWSKDRIERVEGLNGHDQAKELFAVLTEFHFSNDPAIFNNAPASAQLMESIYGEREAVGNGLKTSGEIQAVEATDSESDGNPSTDEAIALEEGQGTDGSVRKVNPEFSNHFKEKKTKGLPKNLGDYLTYAREKGVNEKTLDLVVSLVPLIRDAMAARLMEKKIDGGKTQTVLEHIQDGKLQFRRFKAGMLVDPETGKYDENMLDLATVALADWLITNTGSNPNRLNDTLEKLGLSVHEITDEDMNSVMNGVPTSQAADTLGADIMRMWDLDENQESAVDDLEGAIQGFAKEMFTALSDNTNLITVQDVTLLRDGERTTTQTILVKNDELNSIRKEIQENNGRGVKLTSKEGLFGDRSPIYSIGAKIRDNVSTQNRSNVILSELEQKARRKMQNTPAYLDDVVGSVYSALGESLQKILGYRADVEEIENPVLRRSVRGKNSSILSNIDEVVTLVNALPEDQKTSLPVYFPVGITKVGRHQYQGPNPQSNKVMRALITPTWSTVAVNNLDNFWIAVGQASKIKRIDKAEKLNHAEIISKAPELFYKQYGEAVAQIKALILGGELDNSAFEAAVGTLEAQQLKAIIAVAQLEVAVANGDTSFKTSLSFELDGLTNGVANMMVNFGQGILSIEDYENFKRVGFFPGKLGETVNKFFSKVGNLDMYETTSRAGDKKMWEGHNRLKDWQKAQRIAAGTLATVIGNFEMVDGKFQMTRDSSKNPMTKVNYGSGVKGVAVGVADDMILKFYEEMQNKPADVTVDQYFYEGFTNDMATMGLTVPTNPSKAFTFSREQVKKFQTSIQFTIGTVLTEATKETIGDKINELNKLMVMSTSVQSQYLKNIYNERLAELGESLAEKDVIERTDKGVPQYGQIPRKHFRKLEKELAQMAPIFVSDDQTLAIGGFAKQLTDLVTSTNYDERLNQKTLMPLPDDVGVKSIPFTVIGTGDAMMMNLIFGSDNAPNDVLGIFDGLDIPLDKIQEYAPYVNEQVSKSWDRDVLSMVVMNFKGFLAATQNDAQNVATAFRQVAEKNKDEEFQVYGVEDLMKNLEERLRQNQARKKVFKDLALSVDQMGGSNIGFQRPGLEMGINEINTRIQRILEGKPQVVVEQVTEPIHETTVKAVLKELKLTTEQKKVLSVLGPNLPNTRVIMGTVDQVRDWMIENLPDTGGVLPNVKGSYDTQSDILFLTTKNTETVLHELVHAATFNKVLDHYNGQSNDAVTNLEVLMNDFLALDPKSSDGMKKAQAAILRHTTKNDPFSKAAAVNEFMAYALTNKGTKRRLKSEGLRALGEMMDRVVKLMRRLMGGIPNNMFDQVAFNTAILNNPPIDDGEGGDGGNGDGGTGNGEQTPNADNYSNYWLEQLADYIDSLDENTPVGNRRKLATSKDILNADKVLDNLRQAGLLSNANDRKTFRAIYGIIKSEMILDPNSLIALTKVFQHVEEQMTPEMFGSGSEAANTYSAILNSFGGFKNGETSDAVAVLFALSQTSKKFRDVLDQIPEPETQAPGTGLNAFLARGTNIFMKKLMGSLNDGAPTEVLDGLKQTLIEADRENEYAVLQRVTGSLTVADTFVSGVFQKSAEYMRRVDADTKATSANTVKQYLISAVTATTNMLDRPGSELNASAAQKSVHMGLPILSIVPIRELVDEFVGSNKDNADFMAMLDVVNSKISGIRQAYREKLPGILNKQFSTEPVPEQWQAMQKTVANTDFTSIVDIQNMQDSMQLLEERGVRQARILSVEQTLQGKLVPYVFQDAKEKAEQLATYMNTKVAGKLLVKNAYAIVKNLDGDFDETLVPIINELVTLYAIDSMDADMREITVQLWQNEPRAMTGIVSFIQGLNEAEDQKAVSEIAKLNGLKGYIPNIGKDNHRIIVAPDSQEQELIHRGYKKVSEYTGDIDTIFPQSYYVTNISQQGMYSQGIMQNVASTYRGVDVNSGMSVTGDTAGLVSGGGTVDRTMQMILDPSFVLEDESESLIPVFDADNAVIGFERSINPAISEGFLGRDENLAVNMGAWAGRQVEEELSTQYNKALIDKLDDLYQNKDSLDLGKFVNLSTTNEPIYKESFKLIPAEIKSYADSKFDGTGMMVPESMVNLSVGYREASVADLWTGNTRMPDKLVKTVQHVTKMQFGQTSLRTVLVKGETIGQGVISDAKNIIVIKSLIVPVANTQANILQLSTNGVPNKVIIQGYRKKLAEITEFNKNVDRLIELRHEDRMTSDTRRKRLIVDKIQVIEDLNARMSIAPMIAAGAYKQLSEGLTDVDVAQTNGGLADYLEGLANKLPDTLGAVMENGLVSKSTTLYKAANRATQYGDFLAKSIFYDHLVSKGLSETEALKAMNEEFVNFSFLPGRTRSMLERNGLIWFMNFKIRITKIAMKQMRENPVRAMAFNTMFDFGSPISDNIFTVIGEGRIGYPTGYEMLFAAPELNPWVNLMSSNH